MLFRREEQLVLLMRLEFCLHLVRREAGGKSAEGDVSQCVTAGFTPHAIITMDTQLHGQLCKTAHGLVNTPGVQPLTILYIKTSQLCVNSALIWFCGAVVVWVTEHGRHGCP